MSNCYNTHTEIANMAVLTTGMVILGSAFFIGTFKGWAYAEEGTRKGCRTMIAGVPLAGTLACAFVCRLLAIPDDMTGDRAPARGAEFELHQ